MFALKASHLDDLCRLNEFPVNRAAMVFFGLRGCLPVNPNDHEFRTEQKVASAEINHTHPRCTLIQWLPSEGRFAVFPGSTVPHRDHIVEAKAANGTGANMLLTGYITDYRRGRHKASSRTGHEAWQQTNSRAYRRTTDNLTYDALDRVEWENPGDNLHAAWCGGIDAPTFASAGCQVVVGFPACAARPGQGNTGPWKAFHANAYNRGQESVGYVLLNGTEARRMALNGGDGMERVRFSSKGPRARRVQEALKNKGFYEGIVDGDFGLRSLRALIAFQEAAFGPGGDDGVCGPQTADTLGVAWP